MSMTASIVSLIAVIGALVLAASSPQFRRLGAARMIRLALVWTAIIVGLVLIVLVTGLRIGQ